jgi:hypothetical protein
MRHRCAFLITLALAATAVGAPQGKAAKAAPPPIDLSTPEGAVAADRKMQCSLEDAKPVVFWWKGGAFTRVPGERDRHVFNVEGMNVRQCVTVKDPQRGVGYRLVSREILLYLDIETGEPLTTWKNPWTNEETEVIHVANDPVNGRPSFPIGPNGEPHKFRGNIMKGRVWTSGEAPLFYKNPLGGEYQDYVGGEYHAMEMLTMFTYEKDLVDSSRSEISDLTIAWSRISDFLPWMKMGDRVGMMIFNTVGKRLASANDLSPLMKREISSRYPLYAAPPPVDDARPNETSWTYFKKKLDEKKKAGGK